MEFKAYCRIIQEASKEWGKVQSLHLGKKIDKNG